MLIRSKKKKTYLVEFVSANPTGPLHVGHCRGAVIGDVISNILISLTIILIASFFTNYDWNSYSDNILNSSKCLLSECENESGFLISSTDWIGKLITADFIIAFQLTGLILLASLIGALALLRIRMGNNDS